jgi:MFS family permease
MGLSSLSSTFAAFRHRNYRLWFSGQLVSLVGTWMQEAALGYLVYSITSSTAFLGYVAFASGLPAWLFLLFGGVIADRMPRRTLILITQSVMMALAFLLAGLVFANLVQPWHVLALSFLLGTASAFEMPARQSLVADLVDREDMTNAIALNVTIINTGMIVGPAIAGVVYAVAGPAWCFTINGFSYLAVILALALMKIPARPAARRSSALAAIGEGIQYARKDPSVRSYLFSAFFYNIFDYAMIIFIPAFAVELFQGNAATSGLLMTFNAAGAVAGGLLLAAFASRLGRGKILALSAYITPLMIAGFAASHLLPLSLFFTTVIGVTSITVMNNTNALVQSSVSDELRGRVMSLYSMVLKIGGPLGSVILGVIADRASVSLVLYLLAGMALVYALWVRFLAPQLRTVR